MSQVYSLCPQSAVYLLRVEFMSSEYSLCQQEYSLFLQSTVHVLSVQFYSQEYSLCPQSAVYVPRV